MKAYLEQSFDINKLRGELSDSRSVFYFLFADGKLAGYLKLNESPVQTDISDIQSLEIERIYVAKEFQGVFCKSEFPVFARIPNNFPPGKFVNELSLANS